MKLLSWSRWVPHLTATLLLLTASQARAELAIDPPNPRQATTAQLALFDASGHPVAGAPIRALFSSGSTLERQQTLGATDSLGQLAWTPEASGLVVIESGPHTLTVVVAPPARVPSPALFFLLLYLAPPALALQLLRGATSRLR